MSKKIDNFLEQMGQGKGRAGSGGTDKCACSNPKCKMFKKPIGHPRSIPCNKMKCIVCKKPLTGVGTVGSKIKECEKRISESVDNQLNKLMEMWNVE